MEMEDQRRIYHHKRARIKADSPLGHRYSNAICCLEAMDRLQRSQQKTLQEIAALEMADLLA